VNPSRSNNLYKFNIRGAIQDAVYKAMQPEIPEVTKREESEKAMTNK
jgi:hypothetical protein